MRKKFLQLCVVILLPVLSNAQTNDIFHPTATIEFRHGTETIYRAYRHNKAALDRIDQLLNTNKAAITAREGHLNLVAYIPQAELSNAVALNFAAIRAEAVRTKMKQENDWLKNTDFNFEIVPDDRKSGVGVTYQNTPLADTLSGEIWFTLDKRNPQKIVEMMRFYKSSPVAGSFELPSVDNVSFDILDTAFDNTRTTVVEGEVDQKVMLTLYYRVNKDNVDTTYLTNATTLRSIDSLLHLPSAEYIDTLRITAFASPEGNPDYNQKLSQRRADSMREYLLKRYPRFARRQVVAQGKGINWAGFLRMVESDSDLPLKKELLAVLNNSSLTPLQRQQQVERINNGRLYRDYLLPRYYPRLRSGASLFVAYNPGMPVDIDFEPLVVTIIEPTPPPPPVEIVEVEPEPEPVPVDTIGYRRPVALKTNLLFDLLTLFNVEVEIPLGKRFSLLGEWTFPFWGGLGNAGGVAPIPGYSEKYTIQMLSGMVEGRYWFPRSRGLNNRATKWGDYNPLNGWFVGLFGGAGLYDGQWGSHGMQGEFYIASGVSLGYAHPIGRNLHMEYSLGAGYIATRYYNYTIMDGHKVVDIREDGKYDRRQQSLIGPTRLKVSLVWIPRFKVKGNK